MAKQDKASRLSLLVKLAHNREEQIAGVLAQVQKSLTDASAQLASLGEYEQSYLSKLRSSMSGKGNPYNLTGYQQFISQLASAKEQQQGLVRQAEKQVELVRKEWLLAREKRKSLERLRDSALKEQRIAQEKREEARILDDYVASRYR